MQIEFKNILPELLEHAKSNLLASLKDNSPKIASAVNDYIDNAQDRFTSLVAYLNDEGDAKFLLKRLAEEKHIFRSEVLSLVVIGKSEAENLLNKVQDILINIITKIIFK